LDWQALLVYLAPPEKIGTKPELKEQQSVTNRMGDARAYKKKKKIILLTWVRGRTGGHN